METSLAAMPVSGTLRRPHGDGMHIAIVGAGRIGSAFAFHLSRAGHEVTLVARGARLAELRASGKIISVDGREASVRATDALDPSFSFDLVLVTVLAHQADALLPELRASTAKSVMFMFNTFGPVEPLRDAVGAPRFVSAFPNMTAFFVDGRLKSVVDGPGMVTTLSSAPWAEVFRMAGLPAEVEPDMTAFLRSHVAFVVPLFLAALRTWKRGTELTWVEAKALVEAMREGFAVVRALGHPLRPAMLGAVAKAPRWLLTLVVWAFSRTSAVKDLGAFGPGETRALIDAMAAAAPGQTTRLLALRP